MKSSGPQPQTFTFKDVPNRAYWSRTAGGTVCLVVAIEVQMVGLPFSTRVLELPLTGTLRLLVTAFLTQQGEGRPEPWVLLSRLEEAPEEVVTDRRELVEAAVRLLKGQGGTETETPTHQT